ncbi:probable 4-coumarate--CoA ligase 3 [Chironomus tepperi]|uniref:probable 4-coumarate--CoA ligase 3 n=1 Tax=Chironomus tepperi TaxID=113505 RepID=UPI00391F19CD
MAKYDPSTKIWSSPTVQYLYPMDVYLGEVILKTCSETPDRVIQIHHEKDEALTCKELKESSIKIAENLLKLDIKADDVIGVICQNSNFLTCFLTGSVIMGAIVHPLDHSLSTDNISELYAQSMPKMIICDPDMLTAVTEALEKINLKSLILITSDDPDDADISAYKLLSTISIDYDKYAAPKFSKSADEKLLAILCSSGITGLQKNVCVSHATCLRFDMTSYPKPTSKPLTFSSAYWSSGFFLHMFATFYQYDVRIWSSDDFNIYKLIEIVENRKVTGINLVPSSLAAILQSKQFLSSNHDCLKTFVVLGSFMSESLRNKFNETFPDKTLMVGYGLTEIFVSLTKADEVYDGATVGSMITPNLQIKVVNEDGEAVDPGERGEIRVKLQFKFLGYYNDPEGTANALDADGFLKTGDIGYFDEDGCLYIVDRIKESFKYRNYTVFPSEIENVIQSIDGVELVCVFPVFSENFGTDLAAAAVKKSSSDVKLTEKDIIDIVAERLPEVKHIRGGVYFMDNMPLTPNGKVQTKVVKEIVMKEIEKIREEGC